MRTKTRQTVRGDELRLNDLIVQGGRRDRITKIERKGLTSHVTTGAGWRARDHLVWNDAEVEVLR